MSIRTDLAVECCSECDKIDGVSVEKSTVGEITLTDIYIKTEQGSNALGKPMGHYVTVEMPPLDSRGCEQEAIEIISKKLHELLPSGSVLVVGLGNTDITPDALGPIAAGRVLATRHISSQLSRQLGLGQLRAVCVLTPGVLGRTGIETVETVLGASRHIRPAAVVVIDALAARSVDRLGRTVQLADSGISPGSGVGNSRQGITEAELGVPVISVGVPTVVDAATLCEDLTGNRPNPELIPDGRLIVTPHAVDMLIDRAAHIVAHSLNCALQPHLEPDVLEGLV